LLGLSEKIEGIGWEFEDALTNYLTHNIHRYSGKFIPPIAKGVIEIATKPGDVVLDPYCGSGTTLLEAGLAGRPAIGLDLNPLACLIARVKITPIKPTRLNDFQKQVEKTFAEIAGYNKGPTLLQYEEQTLDEEVQRDSKWRDEWYQKWFGSDNLKELILIFNRIQTFQTEDLKNIAMLAFSDILRKCSYANSTYPNVMFDKRKTQTSQPLKSFLTRIREIIGNIQELENVQQFTPPIVVRCDAQQMPIRDNSVDCVITHPPYIGSIPYAEYGVLSLTWLGFNPKELDQKLTGGKRQRPDVVDRFQTGYEGMLQEAWRVMKPGKICFIMVGNPTVKGKKIDLRQMTTEIGNKVGFSVAAEGKRKGVNRRANLMGEESLLFLRKE